VHSTAASKRLSQRWSAVELTSLDFLEGVHQLAGDRGHVPLDGFLLGGEAEAGSALLLGADPVVGDEPAGDGHVANPIERLTVRNNNERSTSRQCSVLSAPDRTSLLVYLLARLVASWCPCPSCRRGMGQKRSGIDMSSTADAR
jgi:hypothetical protein